MADPGFPRRSHQSQKGVHKPIIYQSFWGKLHENEIIWSRGARPYRPQLGSATALTIKVPIFLAVYKWIENNSI